MIKVLMLSIVVPTDREDGPTAVLQTLRGELDKLEKTPVAEWDLVEAITENGAVVGGCVYSYQPEYRRGQALVLPDRHITAIREVLELAEKHDSGSFHVSFSMRDGRIGDAFFKIE